MKEEEEWKKDPMYQLDLLMESSQREVEKLWRR